MTEADLTRKYLDEVERTMPGALALKHSDRFNSGYPDATVTWAGTTSWWETKFYDERAFKSPETQKRMCRALSVQGVCYYVVYVLHAGVKSTRIVHPAMIDTWDATKSFAISGIDAVLVQPGWDHAWVANFIKRQHEIRRQEHRPGA